MAPEQRPVVHRIAPGRVSSSATSRREAWEGVEPAGARGYSRGITRSPTDYDAWLVDLDGTLYHALPVKAVMAVELVVLGSRAIPTLRTFRRLHERIRGEGGSSNDPYREQLERTAREVGREASGVAEDVARWMQERPLKWLPLFRRRSLFDEIRRFRSMGGKTAVVSDYPARQKIAALGAEALFDAVVANGEPGGPPRLKPDPAGYLLAAERLAVRPDRCLVIGDRDDADGAAARSAGMGFRLSVR